MKLNVGVIGSGFAQLVHCPAFELASKHSVARVCLSSRDSAEWKNLISDPRIHVVSMAVPPSVQPALLEEALRKKKRVLIEKPMSTRWSKSQTLLSLAERSKAIAMINYEYPEFPSWQRAKQFLQRGEIGRIEHTDVIWTSSVYYRPFDGPSWKESNEAGGGFLNYYGSHVFYYVEWFLGPMTQVRCSLKFRSKTFDTGAEIQLKPMKGISVALHLNGRQTRAHHRILIQGDMGKLVLEKKSADPRAGFTLTVQSKSKRFSFEDPSDGRDLRIDATARIVKKLLRTKNNSQTPHPNLEDGCRVDFLLEKARQSHRERRWLHV